MKNDSLGFEIAETAIQLRRSFDGRAQKLGVTRAQWRVLARLNKFPGLKQVELADMLDIEPITLCRHIDRLEEAGLVARRRDPADRRAWRLDLTAQAGPLVEKLTQVATELSLVAFAGLEPADLDTLRRFLAQIRDNCAAAANENRVSA